VITSEGATHHRLTIDCADLALRRRDHRGLLLELATLGPSSIGRAESHVLASIDAVHKALHPLIGYPRKLETKAGWHQLKSRSRSPTPVELSACIKHWEGLLPLVTPLPQAKELPREVKREAVEENTGEKFTFIERLYAYDDFVPDLRLEETTAEARALADVCLVLFNTNEFAYVD